MDGWIDVNCITLAFENFLHILVAGILFFPTKYFSASLFERNLIPSSIHYVIALLYNIG